MSLTLEQATKWAREQQANRGEIQAATVPLLTLPSDIAIPLAETARRLAARYIDVINEPMRQWPNTLLNQGLTTHIREILLPSRDFFRPLEALFAPGTLAGDIRIIQRGRSTEAQRWEAAERIAQRIGGGVRDPKVRRAIRRLAYDRLGPGASSEAIRQEKDTILFKTALPIGVLGAVRDQKRSQTIRLGRDWIVDDSGRKAPVVPNELPIDIFYQWLFARARAEAWSWLKGQFTYESGLPETIDRLDSQAQDLLLAAEVERDCREMLGKGFSLLSERQRSIFQRRLMGRTTQEIAHELKISESTVRQQEMRMRQKLKQVTVNADDHQGKSRVLRRGVAGGAVSDNLRRRAG